MLNMQQKYAINMQLICRICISLCICIFCIYMHSPLCWCLEPIAQSGSKLPRLQFILPTFKVRPGWQCVTLSLCPCTLSSFCNLHLSLWPQDSNPVPQTDASPGSDIAWLTVKQLWGAGRQELGGWVQGGGLKRSVLGWGGGTYISPKGVCDSLVKNREMFFSLITLWSCFKQAKKLDHPNLDHMHKERQSKLPPQDFWHLSNVSPIFMENSKTEVTGRYSFKTLKAF